MSGEKQNSPTRMLSIAFWSGWFFHLSILGVYQDWIGLDRYINKVQSGWMDTHWIMWALFAVISWNLYAWQQHKVNG